MLSPVEGLAKRVRDSGAAFVAVVGNANLRRLELAWAWSIVGHWTYIVAVSVYAYDAGGKGAVGLIFALRLVPAALVAPFAGLLADRYRREAVLVASALTRMLLMGAAAACVFFDVDPWVVYGLAVAVGIATVPFRSAQAAITPSLARTPSELTAANAVVSTIESLAVFLGPALAGVLLAIASTGVVFSVSAAMLAVAALFVWRIRAPRREREPEIEARTIVSEAVAGFRAIGRQPPLRVLIGLLSAQTFVGGALQVFIVVLAFESLGQGESGVGFLNSALGVGALIGGVLALSLTGAARLSRPFAIGVLAWGLPLVLLGAWPQLGLALILLGLVGAGNSYMAVAGLTLEQRAVPDDVLARVFGVIQMVWWLSLAAGALVAPQLIDWLGIQGALIGTGGALVVIVALLWRRLEQIDTIAAAPAAEELRVLASVPIFAPLPGASIEHLAGRLVPLRLEPGAVIVRQGDAGDRFYIIAEGEVDVSEDERPISQLEVGDYFGEIALIRDLPRTATVTARTPVVLYALDREDFLAAVTGHAQSEQAAEEVVSSRLGGLPTGGATRLPAD
jgi:MFS family permease